MIPVYNGGNVTEPDPAEVLRIERTSSRFVSRNLLLSSKAFSALLVLGFPDWAAVSFTE
jgi:hypothetical protein